MPVVFFWYHVLSLLLLCVSLFGDSLLLSGKQRLWLRPRFTIKGSLAIWVLNYSIFYFFFAFFPSTPGEVFILMSILSLLASTGIIASAWLYVLRLMYPSSRNDTRGAVFLSAAIIVSGTAATLSGSTALLRSFLHVFYATLSGIFLSGVFLRKRKGGVPLHEARTLLLLAVSFPVIWLDHLVFNVPLTSGDASVNEGIIATGILAVLWSLNDLRFLRTILTTRGAAAAGTVPDGSLPAVFREEYKLTERESEVGALILQGMSGQEIADTLCISRKTVEAHTYNIYRKCRVKRRTALLALLKEYGG